MTAAHVPGETGALGFERTKQTTYDTQLDEKIAMGEEGLTLRINIDS
jgi:hypothetical protein